jgi:ribulose-5-phosphate 4-epimerase/fuculose-1-phosphate aldolase
MDQPTGVVGGSGEGELLRQLVVANHLLAQHKIVDSWGHVSVRSQERPERFFLARSVAPAQVVGGDLLELEVATGEVVGDAGSYLERHIHAGIYRARPDVQAVVHNHAPALIPFGVTSVALRPVAHVAGFLGAGVPVFDIRDATGSETSMLVDNSGLGDLLAGSLLSSPVVLMRGHGATVVGSSLKQALYRSVYAVQNAAMQAEAMRFGEVNFLSEGESRQAAATIDRSLDRVWDNWVRQLPVGLVDRS